MQTLIKQLEIIKAAIALGDAALLASQVTAWQVEWLHDNGAADDNASADNPTHTALQAIDQALTAIDYARADALITQFVAQKSAIAVYEDGEEDHEMAALKLELAALERKVAELGSERDETVHRIESFNREYTMRLGATLEEILKLHMLLAHGQAEQAQQADENSQESEESEQSQQRQQAYQQAQQNYQQFHDNYEQQKAEPAPQELNSEEQKRLKQAFRRASKRCHPDMVAEEFKTQAQEQFQELNKAYKQNDLATVERILENLQSGGGFIAASEQVTDKERLRVLVQQLRERLTNLRTELEQLKNDAAYTLIESLEDDDAYQAFFDERSEVLENELQQLRQEWQHWLDKNGEIAGTDDQTQRPAL